jgi:gas vesicle protein
MMAFIFGIMIGATVAVAVNEYRADRADRQRRADWSAVQRRAERGGWE